MAPSLTYRRLRAPANDGELLLEPSRPECLTMPAKNCDILAAHDFDFDGQSIQALRTIARAALIENAREYTSQYQPDLPAVESDLIVMAGHQPTLFHPGVWAKNFAIDRLAKSVGAVPIQVLIDNDTMREHSIRMPTGSVSLPEVVAEPFDRFSAAVPFECRRAIDLRLLSSFPDRVRGRVRPFVSNPLVGTMWNDVLAAVEDGKPLGHAFAQGRHLLEQRWGLRTLEIPLSRICDSDTFRHFAQHLFCRAADVRSHYNRRLTEYRRVHRLRSLAQPLPDLRIDADWVELPFWTWTDKDPTRRFLWCRGSGTDIELKSDAGCWTLRSAQRDAKGAVEQLSSLCSDGWRLRPRALTTTMYLRLFLSDCFIHGIGGAKYDQITDLLVHDLFGLTAPGLIALSQTTRLPTSKKMTPSSDLGTNKQLLRSLFHHPEAYLSDKTLAQAKVSTIVEKKRKLIRQIPPRGERLDWHEQLMAVNSRLRQYVEEKTEKQRKFLAEIKQSVASSQLLGTREWSFCLFGEDFLRSRLLDLSFHDL